MFSCSKQPHEDTGIGANWWSVEPQPPEWSAEDFAATIQAQQDAGLPTPAAFAIAYQHALWQGSEECPGTQSQISQTKGCTAESGWFYSGVAHYFVDSYSIELLGDMTIISPEGERMWGGGGMQHYLIVEPDRNAWQVEFKGSWGWTGGEGWMVEGIGVLLSITGSDSADGLHLTINGSLSDEGRALNLSELSWDTEACWEAPSGTILARDPAGGWYQMVLSCSPCSTVEHLETGTNLGELCLDLSPMRDQIAELSKLRGK